MLAASMAMSLNPSPFILSSSKERTACKWKGPLNSEVPSDVLALFLQVKAGLAGMSGPDRAVVAETVRTQQSNMVNAHNDRVIHREMTPDQLRVARLKEEERFSNLERNSHLMYDKGKALEGGY
jgi:hypothetical protein